MVFNFKVCVCVTIYVCSKWKKHRLVERQRKAENGEPDSSDLSDVEVEGGLKMKGKMWNKLYRYAK